MTTFEKILFSLRWLLAPFYLSLAVALVALLVKTGTHAWEMATQMTTLSEEDVILGSLGLVDLTLTACLVVLVVFSTYSNFVARVDANAHPDWPTWMIGIDYGELKLKLIGSIVAISSIKLLEAFMNAERETNRELGWQTGIFGAFVGAALLLGAAEALGRGHNGHGE